MQITTFSAACGARGTRRQIAGCIELVKPLNARLHHIMALLIRQVIVQGPDGGVVTQRTANPCTPVRFRLGPPTILCLYRCFWSLTRRPLPISARFRSRLNNGDKCINPKIDIHRNFIKPLLSNVFSLQLFGGLRIMFRSNAKAATVQSYFGGDGRVGVIPAA